MWDFGSPLERSATREETLELFKEIDEAIHRDNHRLIYKHKVSPVSSSWLH